MRPCSATTSAAIASTDERSVTSVATANASSPRHAASPAVDSASSASTSHDRRRVRPRPRERRRSRARSPAQRRSRQRPDRRGVARPGPNIIARRHAAVSRRATRSTPTAPSTRRSGPSSPASCSRSSRSRASTTTSASPSDFTPEPYARGGGAQWAVTGPISVDGAQAGGAVAVTIHEVEVTTPGVVVYGAYTGDDLLAWWDDESACEVYPAEAAPCGSTSGRRSRPGR